VISNLAWTKMQEVSGLKTDVQAEFSSRGNLLLSEFDARSEEFKIPSPLENFKIIHFTSDSHQIGYIKPLAVPINYLNNFFNHLKTIYE
jgi:hypothetical protein